VLNFYSRRFPAIPQGESRHAFHFSNYCNTDLLPSVQPFHLSEMVRLFRLPSSRKQIFALTSAGTRRLFFILFLFLNPPCTPGNERYFAKKHRARSHRQGRWDKKDTII